MAAGVSTWLHSTLKLSSPARAACWMRHRGGRRGGLEADGEEHHLALRVVAGDLQRVGRRVDHAHIARRAPWPAAATGRREAGHPQHVAVGAQDDAGARSASAIAMSTRPIGSTHTGQPGPWIMRTLARQQVGDAVAEDGVGVAAAELHQAVAAVRVAPRRRCPRRGLRASAPSRNSSMYFMRPASRAVALRLLAGQPIPVESAPACRSASSGSSRVRA